MFLKTLKRRNPDFIRHCVDLHQEGMIPANSYVLDLDAIEKNAKLIANKAEQLGLKVFAMTKQFGRNPAVLSCLMRGGIDKGVAVDMSCARAMHLSGMQVGHLGHLVQVSKNEVKDALHMKPEYWTVFSIDQAQMISDNLENGARQKVLLRIYDEKSEFYRGHEGGFIASTVEEIIYRVNKMPGLDFAGITTFPAQLFDENSKTVKGTPNRKILIDTANRLKEKGYNVEVNAPGTTSSHIFESLQGLGVTQVEPGHGLTGTVPSNVYEDLDEVPAMLYLSEISHQFKDDYYCYGGGLYIDPLFKPYDVEVLVGDDGSTALQNSVACEVPKPEAIDYYAILSPNKTQELHIHDTVIFGFRAQAFVTRAYVTAVSGISIGEPKVVGIYKTDGSRFV